MQTYIYHILEKSSNLHNSMEIAHNSLANQGVIVAPTDTVYGIMCCYDSTQALERLYIAKRRSREKAIPVLVAETSQLGLVTQTPLSSLAQSLMSQFWPGPLTLILSAKETLPSILTAGQPTIAVRMPNHDWLRRLITATGPLAASSANRSDFPETRTVTEVVAQLDGEVPLIVDGGPCVHGIGSTIVDVSNPDQPATILRDGPLKAQVQAMIQE